MTGREYVVDSAAIESRTVTAWQAFMADPDNPEAAAACAMWNDPARRLAFLHGVRFAAAQAMEALREAVQIAEAGHGDQERLS